MARFSANLGFLWTELTLPQAINAAAKVGFDAVECHFPFDTPASDVRAALNDTGLSMLGLNTLRGANGAEDNGVAALVGREAEAKELIDQAVDYAAAIDCRFVHVMAGKSHGHPHAEAVFRKNLAYAAIRAAENGIGILIEPINQRDAPGYHLSLVEKALETMEAVDHDNIRLMFDCYHVQIMQGDLTHRLEKYLPHIGHIQIAAVPDRGEPDRGEIDFPDLIRAIDAMGYEGFIGAEYTPRNTTDAGLGWLEAYR